MINAKWNFQYNVLVVSVNITVPSGLIVLAFFYSSSSAI